MTKIATDEFLARVHHIKDILRSPLFTSKHKESLIRCAENTSPTTLYSTWLAQHVPRKDNAEFLMFHIKHNGVCRYIGSSASTDTMHALLDEILASLQ